jgi:hypothetical protein
LSKEAALVPKLRKKLVIPLPGVHSKVADGPAKVEFGEGLLIEGGGTETEKSKDVLQGPLPAGFHPRTHQRFEPGDGGVMGVMEHLPVFVSQSAVSARYH